MGAKPSQFKKSGGFLNNVDGCITSYEFTDEFPGGDGKPRKGKSDFHSLFCVLSARVDGADEDVTTTFFVGDADAFEIEDDGHTLMPVEESNNIGANTGWGKFIQSLVDAGFPEADLSETDINFEPIIGWRVRFIQRVDVETTKRLGKRKSKDGKREFDRTDVVVDVVYGPPEETKSAGKSVKATKGVSTGKAGKDTNDVAELAIKTLVGILGDQKDNSLPKSKVSMKVLQVLLKHPQREEVRTLLNNDEFLESQDMPWAYDASDKKGVIALAA